MKAGLCSKASEVDISPGTCWVKDTGRPSQLASPLPDPFSFAYVLKVFNRALESETVMPCCGFHPLSLSRPMLGEPSTVCITDRDLS